MKIERHGGLEEVLDVNVSLHGVGEAVLVAVEDRMRAPAALYNLILRKIIMN